MTERAIIQYFGLIKNNMVDIEAKRHIDTPRERKLFYQVMKTPVCTYTFSNFARHVVLSHNTDL